MKEVRDRNYAKKLTMDQLFAQEKSDVSYRAYKWYECIKIGSFLELSICNISIAENLILDRVFVSSSKTDGEDNK